MPKSSIHDKQSTLEKTCFSYDCLAVGNRARSPSFLGNVCDVTVIDQPDEQAIGSF